jgi:hypothetical protein
VLRRGRQVGEQVLEYRGEQVPLGREVPEHGADRNAGRRRDVLCGRGGATRGEHLGRGGEDALVVAAGIGPQRFA